MVAKMSLAAGVAVAAGLGGGAVDVGGTGVEEGAAGGLAHDANVSSPSATIKLRIAGALGRMALTGRAIRN